MSEELVHLWRRRWVVWCGASEISDKNGAEDDELFAVTCTDCLNRVIAFGMDVAQRVRELKGSAT